MLIEIGRWKDVKIRQQFEKDEYCEIEIEQNDMIKHHLEELMIQYRGKNASGPIVYNYEKAETYRDYEYYRNCIGIKCDGDKICFSNFGGFIYDFCNAEIDIRRIFVEILYYCFKNNIKINKISFNSKEYYNLSEFEIIKNDYFDIEEFNNKNNGEKKEEEYLYFHALDRNNNNIKVYLPYLSFKDHYSKYYYHKMYLVENDNTKIFLYKQLRFEGTWVDLFRGYCNIKNKKMWGEFYYTNNGLLPHVAISINYETGEIEFYYSKIKQNNQVGNFEIMKFVNGECIEYFDEDFNEKIDKFDNTKIFFDVDKIKKLFDKDEIFHDDKDYYELFKTIYINIFTSPNAIEKNGFKFEKYEIENNLYAYKNNEFTYIVDFLFNNKFLNVFEEVDKYHDLIYLNKIYYIYSIYLGKFEYVLKNVKVDLDNNYSFNITSPLENLIFEKNMKNLPNISFPHNFELICNSKYYQIGFTFDDLLELSHRNSIFYDIRKNLQSIVNVGITKWFFNRRDEVKSICDVFENLTKEEIDDLKLSSSLFSDEFIKDKQKIRKILFEDDGNIVDENIVEQVYYMVKEYELSGKKDVPNLVIMGDSGTGKTTLAEKIARCFIEDASDDIVQLKTPADIKGEYVGHNQRGVFDLLKETTPNKFNKFICNKVALLDEAYNLGKDDPYGKEIVTILLNVLSGDRNNFSCKPDPLKNETDSDCSISWGKYITPNIWFSGYKDEMLSMLQNNPGLSSRMHEIFLPTPSIEQLFDYLISLCNENDTLKTIVKNEENSIKLFIGWATRPEYKKIFANYRGIKNFYKGFRVRFYNVQFNSSIAIHNFLDKYIVEQEQRIKEYYKVKISNNDDTNYKFEVLTDIKDSFDCYKGNKKLVNSMRNIVDLLYNSKKYNQQGIDVPKGALLVGPPGTGKTLIAKVVAGELQKKYNDSRDKNKKVGFIAVSGAELCGYKGEKVKQLFSIADDYDSCVIFIDEIDSIGANRKYNNYGQDLTQLMIAMDGFEKRKSLFVMAATNSPESLDLALKRPGRFDRIIEVSNLTEENDVVDVLLYYLGKLTFLNTSDNNVTNEIENLAKDIVNNNYDDIKLNYSKEFVEFVDELKKNLYGCSPAQIKNYINEASILFKEIDSKIKMLSNEQIEDMIKKEYPYRRTENNDCILKKFKEDVLEILERNNVGELATIKDIDKIFSIKENAGYSAVALHEVGHAVVSMVLFEKEPFEKITIRPRGNALGYVINNKGELLNTKNQILKQIKVFLAGRAVEEIFYNGDISVGATDDIVKATNLVKQMVENFGFSSLGVMAMSIMDNGYLENNKKANVSNEYMAKVDMEVNKILNEQYEEVKNLVLEYKEIIEKLARYVFEETLLNNKLYLTGEEFKKEFDEILDKK